MNRSGQLDEIFVHLETGASMNRSGRLDGTNIRLGLNVRQGEDRRLVFRPIAPPARPARCSPLGSRAVAFGASYGPLARARRFCGAILAISACLSSAHAAGRGAKCSLVMKILGFEIRFGPILVY